ncbi:Histidyl-tRNA synthetase [Hordeum vulgare]|nr:Histidyl-tRNA synthetase [Hordeum vulgare]
MTRPIPTPTRQNARKAANQSTVPVSQRATLRLVHCLSILGPREKMMEKGAEAFIRRFDEPLSDADMKAIARLTKMDVEALRIAAGMAGPDGAAMEAPGLR